MLALTFTLCAITLLKRFCKVLASSVGVAKHDKPNRSCKAISSVQASTQESRARQDVRVVFFANALSASVSCLLQYWAACIARGQAPNPLSSRDGRQLKLVPKQWALSQSAVAKNLQKVIGDLHTMQAGLLCTAWGTCRQPDKASLALMRGFAYAQAGRYEQALKVR